MLSDEQTTALDGAIRAWNSNKDMDSAAFDRFDTAFGPDSRKLLAAFMVRQQIGAHGRDMLALVLGSRLQQDSPDPSPSSGDGLGTVSTMAEPA